MYKPPDDEKLPIMKPFMVPLNEFHPYLKRIWKSGMLTNNGSMHSELEKVLSEYLGVKYICLIANGTLALILALKVLNIKGKVITTPFTHISTTQSLYWNNLTPIFVDINRDDLNIDVEKIEEAITPDTSALLPVHIFGKPCDVDSINRIANKYNLKVLYDAAHCFGVKLKGTSVCNFGDISVLSFHATKVFNCFEGGAIICHDEATKKHIDALKNCGIDSNYGFVGYGLNAKMNEIQAAYGLLQLKYVDEIIEKRKNVVLRYRDLLKNIKGIYFLNEVEKITYNYSFFPIIINPDEYKMTRDELYEILKGRQIDARKYFYPLVSDFPEFNPDKSRKFKTAELVAKNILCLPLFHDISLKEQINIASIISQ